MTQLSRDQPETNLNSWLSKKLTPERIQELVHEYSRWDLTRQHPKHKANANPFIPSPACPGSDREYTWQGALSITIPGRFFIRTLRQIQTHEI